MTDLPDIIARPAWQPIETAPKDGTEIILLLGGHAVSGRWLENEPGYVGAGWLTLESRESFYMPHVPTHWQPLELPA